MLLVKEPPFANRLGSLWHTVTHIPDLETLKQCILDSTLVAFDIEGRSTRIQELGLASLAVTAEKSPCLPSDGELRSFYQQNAVQAHTIKIRGRESKNRAESIKFGDCVTVKKYEASATLTQILSTIAASSTGRLILVGFDMYMEFDWISRECPSILSRFEYWVDAQEIAEERCRSHPSLLNTLAAMNITDRPPGAPAPSNHRASNDAVRTLAVLSGLSSLDIFKCGKASVTKLFSSPPEHWQDFRFKALITTSDNDVLPVHIRIPHDLSAHFAAYNPKAVLIDRHTFDRSNGVREWWVCLPSPALLDVFATDVDGSVLHGKQLAVEKFVHSRPTGQLMWFFTESGWDYTAT